MDIKYLNTLGKKTYVLYDLKYIFSKKDTDLRL